jgi:hypothetical protein
MPTIVEFVGQGLAELHDGDVTAGKGRRDTPGCLHVVCRSEGGYYLVLCL